MKFMFFGAIVIGAASLLESNLMALVQALVGMGMMVAGYLIEKGKEE